MWTCATTLSPCTANHWHISSPVVPTLWHSSSSSADTDSTNHIVRQHTALSEVLSRNLRRVLKVYIYYWITLAVFIPLGCWMYGYGTYPGDVVTLLENITAWRTSYNGEIWFLFPYILLVFISVPLYRLVDRYHWLVILLCSYTLVLFNTLLGNTPIYGMLARSVRPVYYVLLTSNLAFSFLLGMVTARHLDIANLKAFFRGKAWIGYLMLLAIVVARLLGFIMHPLYATIIIIVFACMPHFTITRNTLQELGRRSTSMWFIHSWFCYYLFHDWVYSFEYPLLIFAVLVAVSYLCAIPVDWLQKHIWSRING